MKVPRRTFLGAKAAAIGARFLGLFGWNKPIVPCPTVSQRSGAVPGVRTFFGEVVGPGLPETIFIVHVSGEDLPSFVGVDLGVLGGIWFALIEDLPEEPFLSRVDAFCDQNDEMQVSITLTDGRCIPLQRDRSGYTTRAADDAADVDGGPA